MLRRVWLRVGPRAHGPTAESLAKPKALCCTTTWGYPALFLSPSHGAALGLRKTALCARVAPGEVLLHLKLSSLPWPGQARPWGTACPCTARSGSASAPYLCRWLYEGVSRQKAEELLLRPGNRSGSFLIRESQTRQGESPWAPTPVPPPSHAH